MMKPNPLIFLFLFFVSPCFVFAHSISPIYETLIENKINALKREAGESIQIQLIDRSVADDHLQLHAKVDAAVHQHPEVSLFLVSVKSQLEVAILEPLFSELNLAIVDHFPERELEFVTDVSGRQLVDLGLVESIQPLYERLVYEGMNPVSALPQAQHLVAEFVSRTYPIILVAKRT